MIVRASATKTPQPSPLYNAALEHVLSREEQRRLRDFAGTPERLSALREACLLRDRHRCVVSRAFDEAEAIKRFEGQNGPAVDDDGNDLTDSDTYQYVEVAHIIPCSLTKADDGRIDGTKKAAIMILNMFDHGVVHLLEGPDMNRPYNAITLSRNMHKRFGEFKVFFERTPDADPPNTYRIGSFLPPALSRLFPVTRTLFSHPTIDPPSERLLALHYAIAHILRLSGAGNYISNILRDLEDGIVRSDGSTELGVLVDLALKVQ